MRERVVEVVVARVGRRPHRSSVRSEPQLLVVTDVREVPHQRRHERRHLPTAGRRRRTARGARASGSRACSSWSATRSLNATALQLALSGSGRHRPVAAPFVEPVVGRAAAALDVLLDVRLGRRRSWRHRRRHAAARRARRRSTHAPHRPSAGQREAVRRRLHPRVAHRFDGTTPSRAEATLVVEEHRGDGRGHVPPRRRERVDHAQLEPPTRAHRREQRREVVLEVLERRPPEVVAVVDPLARTTGAASTGTWWSVVLAHEHHARAERVVGPRGATARAVADAVSCAPGRSSRQTARRVERHPLGPSVRERASSRTRRRAPGRGRGPRSTGARRRRPAPRSTFTWIAAVLRIIVRPAGPLASKYASIAS